MAVQDGIEDAARLAWSGLTVAGVVLVVVGITRWLTSSPDERRLLRWRSTRRAPIDGEDLARFEGELRADAESAASERWIGVGLGIGVALGGAAGLGLTAAFGTDDLSWGLGYGGSALGILLGTGLALLGLDESRAEEVADAYERGFAPRRSLRVTPIVGSSLVGLVASGSL